MAIESKNLENIFCLANQFENFSDDKFVRIAYETELNTVEIEIISAESFETLKSIKYKIETQEDIDELENILEMYVQKEEE